jgi:hypothetical protein
MPHSDQLQQYLAPPTGGSASTQHQHQRKHLCPWAMSLPLYTLHLLRCISDRSWAFLLPLHLSTCFPRSLYEVSTVAAFATIGSVLFTPRIALYLQKRRGLGRFYLLLALENMSVMAAGALLVQFHPSDTAATDGLLDAAESSTAVLDLTFYAAGVLLAVDQCCSGVLENLVVKEWTVVVATIASGSVRNDGSSESGDNSDTKDGGMTSVASILSKINSRMSQIDLAVGVVVPFTVSALLKYGTDTGVLWMLLLWHATTAVVIAALASQVCVHAPECATSSVVDAGLGSMRHAWVEFTALPRVARYNVAAYILL